MDKRTRIRVWAFMMMLETMDRKEFEKCYNYLIFSPGKSAEQKHDARLCRSKVFAVNPRWS